MSHFSANMQSLHTFMFDFYRNALLVNNLDILVAKFRVCEDR